MVKVATVKKKKTKINTYTNGYNSDIEFEKLIRNLPELKKTDDIKDTVKNHMRKDVFNIIMDLKYGYNDPNINVVLQENDDGFTFWVEGEGLFFREFGTGKVGEGTYPDQEIINKYKWDYAVGTKIWHNGELVNGDVYTDYSKQIESLFDVEHPGRSYFTLSNKTNTVVPKWYDKALEGDGENSQGNISLNDYVWMTPKPYRITKGDEASAVWYYAVEESELFKGNYLSSKALKKSLKLQLKSKLKGK